LSRSLFQAGYDEVTDLAKAGGSAKKWAVALRIGKLDDALDRLASPTQAAPQP